MSSLNPLRQLLELDPPSKFPDQFDTILRGKEYQQWVQVMQDDDVVKLVNCLDRVCGGVLRFCSHFKPPQALDVLDPASPSFRKCMRELRQICCTKTIFPSSHTFSPQDLNTGDRPFTSGGFSDVYEGALRGAKVCVKRIRVYPNSNPIRQAKVLRHVFSCLPLLKSAIGILPRGCSMETLGTQKRRSFSWNYHNSSPAYLGVDTRWRTYRVHTQRPGCGPCWSRKCSCLVP